MDAVNPNYIANAIDVTPTHVRYLIREGEIEAQKFHHAWIVPRDEADRFIAKYLANPPRRGPKSQKRQKRQKRPSDNH